MAKVCPFNSIISPGFWQKFFDIALDQKSVASRHAIWGYYGPTTINASIFSVDHTSFDERPASYYNQVAVKGEIVTTESLEEFKKMDKNQLIKDSFRRMNFDSNEELLPHTTFVLLAYPDLKSYTFTYWFAFPATSSIHITEITSTNVPEIFTSEFGSSKKEWESGFFLADSETFRFKSLEEDSGNAIFGYLEPSGINQVPGWVIRNYLAYVIKNRKISSGEELKLLSLRPWKTDFSQSCVYSIKVEFSDDWESDPKILGWERTDDKLMPKSVDLKSNLDPVTLSASFVDFNLKLMKWRVFPEFDLEMMHNIKVCILGAGTLGCNVARALMGWGVRQMSIVDSGKVSYSNPVRQSLFNFTDAGKPKAVAAAESLRLIFPGMEAKGFELHIPMPGHPSSQSTIGKIKEDFRILDELIRGHDVIFLLTDTRESRWLPTILGAAYNKLVINAALGFERYVVLRHGRRMEDLGCYFCTDVVAPGDSTQDRTLDQQCTVTRPGVSMIAAALAVELMASVIHYDKEANQNPTLGLPPHNIRGWVSSSQQISPTFQKFDKCSACSDKVVDGFKEEGIELVLKVLNDPSYLERLCGLDKLKEGIDGIVELEEIESD